VARKRRILLPSGKAFDPDKYRAFIIFRQFLALVGRPSTVRRPRGLRARMREPRPLTL